MKIAAALVMKRNPENSDRKWLLMVHHVEIINVSPARSQILRFHTSSWHLSTSLEKAKNLICMSMSWCGCHVHCCTSSMVHSASRRSAFLYTHYRDHENGVNRDPQWTHICSFPRNWKSADWQLLVDVAKLVSDLQFSYPFVSILPV